MSWKATAMVKELTETKDGVTFTRDAKFVYLLLADYHNQARRAAWPSLTLLAKEALMAERHCRRQIRWLELHGEIRQLRPKNQGARQISEYQFLRLDDMETSGEGGQGVPLLSSEKGDRRGTGCPPSGEKGGQKGDGGVRAIRKNGGNGLDPKLTGSVNTPETTQTSKVQIPQDENQNLPMNGTAGYGPVEAWRALHEFLRCRINRHSFGTWIEPLRARALSGGSLLVAVPAPAFLHLADKYGELMREGVAALRLPLHEIEFIATTREP